MSTKIMFALFFSVMIGSIMISHHRDWFISQIILAKFFVKTSADRIPDELRELAAMAGLMSAMLLLSFFKKDK